MSFSSVDYISRSPVPAICLEHTYIRYRSMANYIVNGNFVENYAFVAYYLVN